VASTAPAIVGLSPQGGVFIIIASDFGPGVSSVGALSFSGGRCLETPLAAHVTKKNAPDAFPWTPSWLAHQWPDGLLRSGELGYA
jgi:hypothetical protein